jgi:hypothetical protein
MSEINFTDPDRLLDQIVTALAAEPVPDFRDPLASDPESAVPRETRATPLQLGRRDTRSWTQWTIVGVVTIILAALVILLSSSSPITGPGAAFAQVQQAVSNSKSIRFRTLDYHGNRDPMIVVSVSVPGVGARSEGPDGWVFVTNFTEERLMTIDHRAHKAQIDQIYLDPRWSDTGTLEKLRNLPASGAKSLGRTVFEGKPVLQFACENEGEFVVLVDPKTNLPVRMELKMEKGLPGGEAFREVMTDFIFDAPVDASEFAIKPPPGYEVTRCEEPSNRKPIDARTWTVSPQEGFGPLRRDASKAQILAALGTPDQIEETYRGPEVFKAPGVPVKGQPEVVFETLHYPSRGFEIYVSSRKGMMGFNCFGRLWRFEPEREFPGKTDRQIAMGASIADVLKAYGEPEVQSHGRDDVLQYLHKGWWFHFRLGKLDRIQATEPLSDRIEVTPTGDGGYSTRVKGNTPAVKKK